MLSKDPAAAAKPFSVLSWPTFQCDCQLVKANNRMFARISERQDPIETQRMYIGNDLRLKKHLESQTSSIFGGCKSVQNLCKPVKSTCLKNCRHY